MQAPDPLQIAAGLNTLLLHDADWQIVPSGELLTPQPATFEQVYSVQAWPPPVVQSVVFPPLIQAPPEHV